MLVRHRTVVPLLAELLRCVPDAGPFADFDPRRAAIDAIYYATSGVAVFDYTYGVQDPTKDLNVDFHYLLANDTEDHMIINCAAGYIQDQPQPTGPRGHCGKHNVRIDETDVNRDWTDLCVNHCCNLTRQAFLNMYVTHAYLHALGTAHEFPATDSLMHSLNYPSATVYAPACPDFEKFLFATNIHSTHGFQLKQYFEQVNSLLPLDP